MTALTPAACFYCERAGQPLVPCCVWHPDDLVCADRTGCRDFMLAQLAGYEARA